MAVYGGTTEVVPTLSLAELESQIIVRRSVSSRVPGATFEAARAHAELIETSQRPELSWNAKGWDWEYTVGSDGWVIRELVSTAQLITGGYAKWYYVVVSRQ